VENSVEPIASAMLFSFLAPSLMGFGAHPVMYQLYFGNQMKVCFLHFHINDRCVPFNPGINTRGTSVFHTVSLSDGEVVENSLSVLEVVLPLFDTSL
jgi:hypothetical protein